MSSHISINYTIFGRYDILLVSINYLMYLTYMEESLMLNKAGFIRMQPHTELTGKGMVLYVQMKLK